MAPSRRSRACSYNLLSGDDAADRLRASRICLRRNYSNLPWRGRTQAMEDTMKEFSLSITVEDSIIAEDIDAAFLLVMTRVQSGYYGPTRENLQEVSVYEPDREY